MSSPVGSGFAYSREGVAVTAAVDLFEAVCTGRYVRVGGLLLSQSSDVGDAAEEILPWRFFWGNTSSGSGGASPDAVDTGYGRADGSGITTIESFNTTAASGGSAQGGVTNSFNIRAGEALWFPPGLEPLLIPDDGGGELNALRLMAAPADSLTMSATLFIYGVMDA